MVDEYVTVDYVSGRHIAEAIKSFLEDRDIECMLSQEAGGAFGFSVGGLARVEIRVPSKKVDEAQLIISEYREQMQGS